MRRARPFFLTATEAAALVAAATFAAPAQSAPPCTSPTGGRDLRDPAARRGLRFEVWVRLEGTFKGTIHTSRSGLASELDTQPHTRLTTYSPGTGKSFSVMFSTVFHTVYPDGLVPGGRVVADVTGFVDKVPGKHASAGHTRFPDGEIIEVVDGVPYVNYGEPDLEHGSLYDGGVEGEELDALTCARLAP